MKLSLSSLVVAVLLFFTNQSSADLVLCLSHTNPGQFNNAVLEDANGNQIGTALGASRTINSSTSWTWNYDVAGMDLTGCGFGANESMTIAITINSTNGDLNLDFAGGDIGITGGANDDINHGNGESIAVSGGLSSASFPLGAVTFSGFNSGVVNSLNGGDAGTIGDQNYSGSGASNLTFGALQNTFSLTPSAGDGNRLGGWGAKFVVETVPEPSSFAMVGFALFCCSRRQRK